MAWIYFSNRLTCVVLAGRIVFGRAFNPMRRHKVLHRFDEERGRRSIKAQYQKLLAHRPLGRLRKYTA